MMEIRPVSPEEAETVVDLIRRRIAWMEAQGLRQWNATGYLEAYPPDYFARRAAEGVLFAGLEAGRPLAALALLEEDGRWSSGGRALYVHHLVASPDAPGAGSALLAWAEEHARSRGMEFLRLDSQHGNPALDRYYEARGYQPAGWCREGDYLGWLREKRLL